MYNKHKALEQQLLRAILHVDANKYARGYRYKASPGHLLELSADDAVKPNGGSWAGPSDRRLKNRYS